MDQWAHLGGGRERERMSEGGKERKARSRKEDRSLSAGIKLPATYQDLRTIEI